MHKLPGHEHYEQQSEQQKENQSEENRALDTYHQKNTKKNAAENGHSRHLLIILTDPPNGYYATRRNQNTGSARGNQDL